MGSTLQTPMYDVFGYIDFDFACSLMDRRSTTRYCIFLARDLVTWRSKKQ